MGLIDLFRKKKSSEEIKKELDRKLDKHKGDKDIDDLKRIVDMDNLKDDFFDILFRLGYTKNKEEKKMLLKKAKEIAAEIPEFAGWPASSKFWDVEALAWIVNIPEKVRKYIKSEINRSIPKGLNLALGCGSYPYVKDSVLVDFSEEMLRSAGPKYKNKVLSDLNSGDLAFRSCAFDSVTMVFVINYIKNLGPLLKEAERVLKEDGKLIIVQSAKQIAEFYRMKEEASWKPDDAERMMKNLGFKTNVYEHLIGRTRLIFFEGVKQ